MKKFRNYFLLALALSVGFVACDDDDDDDPAPTTSTPAGPTQNIAEIAIGSGQTDSLVVALSQVGLVPTFQDPDVEFTVFAPTNQAFVDLLATNMMWNSIADIDNATLTAVLNYHVVAGTVTSGMLTDDTYATTLNAQGGPDGENTSIEVDVTGGVMLNNEAMVTTANVAATNGVVHIIDKVIMPQSIVDFATKDERLTSLVAALTAFPSFNYVATLSGTGPFTVFAPTNSAFQALIDGNPNWNSLADIDSVTLASVLEYHVVASVNAQAKSLTQGQMIPTLNGNDLTVDLTSGAQLMTTGMQTVNITQTDLQGTNGVIHVVDEVLLP